MGAREDEAVIKCTAAVVLQSQPCSPSLWSLCDVVLVDMLLSCVHEGTVAHRPLKACVCEIEGGDIDNSMTRSVLYATRRRSVNAELCCSRSAGNHSDATLYPSRDNGRCADSDILGLLIRKDKLSAVRWDRVLLWRAGAEKKRGRNGPSEIVSEILKTLDSTTIWRQGVAKESKKGA